MDGKLLIIIPAYNEAENIGGFLEKIKNSKIDKIADILVIDDGSTDNTETIVREHGVNILSKPINMGYGSTLKLGYKYAYERDYEYIVQIDADGQHDAENIKVIIDALCGSSIDLENRPDIVIGSRFLCENNEYKISWLKNIAITFFRKIIRVFTDENITDPTSGLQGLNRRAFSYYAGYGNFDYRYPDINMIIQMLMIGFKIKEVPAKMYRRQGGKGMHSGIFKPIAYMTIMSLSTIAVILRQREGYYKARKISINEDRRDVSKI